jgi:predicted TPR repeat methyltransferase
MTLKTQRQLADAVAAHQAGRLDEAEALYRKALKRDPLNGNALSLLGLIAHQRGRPKDAVELIGRAIRRDGRVAPWHDNLGLAFQALGRAQEAADSHRRALAIDPTQASALNNLGNALRAIGEPAEAIARYQAALLLMPDFVEAMGNLGLARQLGHDPAGAARDHGRVVRLTPRDPDAQVNLGLARQQAGDREGALAAYRAALALDWTLAVAHAQRGGALLAADRPGEAAPWLVRALLLDPAHGEALANHGLLRHGAGQVHDAARWMRRALAVADDPGTRHQLAIATGGQPASAPAEYVVRVFDAYADRFERELVDKLEYAAPAALHAAVMSLGPRRFGTAVDLGCGTGLVGRLFRPEVARLVGIDLAPRMIDRARALGIYDELVTADIVAALNAMQAGSVELVTAGDVFIYVGALDSSFAAVARALAPGGLFAFSTERLDQPGRPVLRPTGRYAHARAHVEQIAAEHGLEARVLREVALRLEAGEKLPGQVFVLVRP